MNEEQQMRHNKLKALRDRLQLPELLGHSVLENDSLVYLPQEKGHPTIEIKVHVVHDDLFQFSIIYDEGCEYMDSTQYAEFIEKAVKDYHEARTAEHQNSF